MTAKFSPDGGCPVSQNKAMHQDDAAFLADFESAHIPCKHWHHREHIKVGYLYLRRLPFTVSLERMREMLAKLNLAHQVPDLPHRGFHETMTVVWLRLVEATLAQYGPAASSDEFCDKNPQLIEKNVLRFFYSQERIMSPQAKQEFVEPDLAPLPKSPT